MAKRAGRHRQPPTGAGWHTPLPTTSVCNESSSGTEATEKNGHRVLCLRGPLLISNLFEFQSTVRANTTSFLILDLTQVPYVDSAGVGALVGAYVSHDKGRRLALVGVTERVRNTMHVAHVEQFFQFYQTAKAAQEAHMPSADSSAGSGGNNKQHEIHAAFQPNV